MNTIRHYILVVMTLGILILGGCQKDNYELGDLVTPTNVTLTYEIVGADAENPNGDGSGVVNFIATASNQITFNYEFGDGKSQVSSDGKISHSFSRVGVNSYHVTVFAIGTGGISSSVSTKIDVLSTFEDSEALEFLTGGSSKSWFWAADQLGHAGMGTQTQDYGNGEYTWASWWQAAPWEKECMYDAEFVFTKTTNGLTFEQIAGPAFVPGYYANEIGIEGDVCHGDDVVPNLVGVKTVSFSASTSKASIDGAYRGTSMDFSDQGFMCWWVGTSEYDIIEVTENILKVRIKQDVPAGAEVAAAWYHTFTNVKPEQK